MTTTTRAIGLISIDTKVLFDRLITANVGDVIPYSELTELIGRDVRGSAIWALGGARRKAFRERSFVFAAVRNEGVKRLSDLEIVDTGEDTASRIHRMSRRGAQRLMAVADFNALPNESKIRHNTYASLLGMTAHVTKNTQVKRLAAKIEKTQAQLPLQRTLEAFSA